MPDTTWYALLTEAQAHYFNVYAAHFPYVLFGAPTTLTSSDGGITFPFPNDPAGNPTFPLAVEVYDATGPARVLRPGAYWDASADFVWEGNKIRFPQNLGNIAGFNIVVRFVTPPDVLDASHAPTLQPPHTRLLLVYRAVAEWARRGGMRDPKPFKDLEQEFWMGNPALGDTGVLGALKLQNSFLGASAILDTTGGLLDGVDTGTGYRGMAP